MPAPPPLPGQNLGNRLGDSQGEAQWGRVGRDGPPPDLVAPVVYESQSQPKPIPPALIGVLSMSYVPYYLGTAERTPRIGFEPAYLPWHDDEFSTQLPADELYDGETATVVADLTRWWELVYRYIATRTKNQPVPVGRDGVDFPGSVGTSTVHEIQNHPLWVQFPFGAKRVHGGRGLPAGYRFWSAKLIAPDEADDLGHQPMRRRLIWRCQQFHDLASGAKVLYDHDMANPPLPRVT